MEEMCVVPLVLAVSYLQESCVVLEVGCIAGGRLLHMPILFTLCSRGFILHLGCWGKNMAWLSPPTRRYSFPEASSDPRFLGKKFLR